MRFRAGLVIGFATGFYVGAMAGRESYEQINRTLHRAKRSDAFDAATDKAKAVVDLGVERAKDIVGTKFGRDQGNGEQSDPGGADPLAHSPSRPSSAGEAAKTGDGDSPH